MYQFEEYTPSGNGQSLTSDGLDINYQEDRQTGKWERKIKNQTQDFGCIDPKQDFLPSKQS